MPLVRLDFGALYDKYHGESERRLRDALATAEVVAPCVLWIDELVRKGRFDEIFFVDLPARTVRQDIFAVHLRKRQIDPQRFNLAQLAQASQGFSGAEIEQAVVAALYRAHAENRGPNVDHVLEEIRNTSPLSVVMAEKLQALRYWASERAVSAD